MIGRLINSTKTRKNLKILIKTRSNRIHSNHPLNNNYQDFKSLKERRILNSHNQKQHPVMFLKCIIHQNLEDVNK